MTLDIAFKCSPGEISAKNCLDHVICPYKEIGQIISRQISRFPLALLLKIGLGLGLESNYRVSGFE